MKALVLGGGGSRGAYQAGAILNLIVTQEQSYDIFCGTSVGAINAAFLAQYAPDEQGIGAKELIKLWKKLKPSDIYSSWPIFGFVTGLLKRGLYNAYPLEKLIRKVIKPEDFSTKLRITATSLSTGDLNIFTEKDVDIIHKVIYGSAAVPVMFEPIRINSQWFCDGGIRDLTPLKSAIEAGATEIHIINCQNITPPVREMSNATSLDILPRATEIMLNEIMRNDLQALVNINRDVDAGIDKEHRFINFKFIQPTISTKLSDSLDFSQPGLSNMAEEGYWELNEIAPYNQDNFEYLLGK